MKTTVQVTANPEVKQFVESMLTIYGVNWSVEGDSYEFNGPASLVKKLETMIQIAVE